MKDKLTNDENVLYNSIVEQFGNNPFIKKNIVKPKSINNRSLTTLLESLVDKHFINVESNDPYNLYKIDVGTNISYEHEFKTINNETQEEVSNKQNELIEKIDNTVEQVKNNTNQMEQIEDIISDHRLKYLEVLSQCSALQQQTRFLTDLINFPIIFKYTGYIKPIYKNSVIYVRVFKNSVVDCLFKPDAECKNLYNTTISYPNISYIFYQRQQLTTFNIQEQLFMFKDLNYVNIYFKLLDFIKNIYTFNNETIDDSELLSHFKFKSLVDNSEFDKSYKDIIHECC